MSSLVLSKPLIGVLVSPGYLKRLSKRWPPMAPQLYTKAAKDLELTVFFFSWKEADRYNMTIWGWWWSNGLWANQNFPWPEVYYDQHKGPVPQGLHLLRSSLSNTSLPLNTVSSIDKWTTYEHLARNLRLRRLQPATTLMTVEDNLRVMLKRHPAVIAKPSGGSRGRGISKIWRDGLHYGFQSSEVGAVTESGLTLRQVYDRVTEHAQAKPVVLQKQIELARLQARLCDLRVMVNKNSVGRWQASQDFMRLGREGSFITNWDHQAKVVSVPEGLALMGWPRAVSIRYVQRVHRMAVRIAEHLELWIGRLGELGLDFGIDTKRRLWFFEANARPDKAPLRHDQWDPVPAIYKLPIEYAAFLYKSHPHLPRHNVNQGPSKGV